MRKIKQELLKKAIEEKVDIDYVNSQIEKIEKDLTQRQEKINNEILEHLVREDGSITCPVRTLEIPINFLTVLCTPSETDLSRPEKQDEYDQSAWLSENVKKLMYGLKEKVIQNRTMRYAWWFKGNYAGNRFCMKDDVYGENFFMSEDFFKIKNPLIFSTIFYGKSMLFGTQPVYRWYVNPYIWEIDPYLYPLPTLFHRFKDLKNESDEEKHNYYEWLKIDICDYF